MGSLVTVHMGCLLGLWVGRLLLTLLSFAPCARWKSLDCFGQIAPQNTHTHEKWGEKKRQTRMGNIPYARDVTRKHKIDVTNSKAKYEKP